MSAFSFEKYNNKVVWKSKFSSSESLNNTSMLMTAESSSVGLWILNQHLKV